MPDDQTLHPAEHRGLRELQAAARHLAGHWTRLARRLGGEPAGVLERGAAAARELAAGLPEHAAGRDLAVLPAAQVVGARGAGLRGAGDVMLERNQALRGAVLDAQHLTTLLRYLAALAETRRDAVLAGWELGWAERFGELEEAARGAAIALGADPESAVEPAEPTALGRAGHAVALGMGTLGEAIDSSLARRRVSGEG